MTWLSLELCIFRVNVSQKSPKLFFVSTSSTTSTLSSTTLCYSTVAAAAVTQTCSGRKKRHLISDEAFDSAFNIEAEASHEDIISGMDEATAERYINCYCYILFRRKKN